jgi:hypothetical protein
LASAQATLQNNINELTETVNSGLTNIYANIAPNMNAGVSITSGWTATKSGWVYAQRWTENAHSYLYINGKEALRAGSGGSYSSLNHASMVYVGKDERVTFDKFECTFYPCKGVQDA